MVSSVLVPGNDNNDAPDEQRAIPGRASDEPEDVAQGEATGEVRLQKVLARAGIASRRHAEEMIVAGRVRVNGRVVEQLGTRVDVERDAVTVDGRSVSLQQAYTYLALNKPAGYVTTASDPAGRRTVMDLLPDVPGLFSIGRLDLNSEGLLLLTTDGEWGQQISHPRHGSTKEYLVEVSGRPRPADLAVMRQPMAIDAGEWSSGAEVRLEGSLPDRSLLRIVLHEGRNRQIRRMLDGIGHTVLSLVRVRVGAVELGDLRPSEWRHLTHAEIAMSAGAKLPKSERPAPRGVRRRRPT